MGANFYIFGILIAIALTCLAVRLWWVKHRKELEDRIVGWACYSMACRRGFIKPSRDEDDRKALEYATKYHKKQPWIVC